MADHILETRLTIARPRDEVFSFFADPRNLGAITPPWLRFTLLTTTPIMEAGAVLDYRITWLGIPLRWRTFVREYDPPFRFLDVQLLGPYARWEHRHRFLVTREGTLVEDRLVYQLPAGPLGRVVHAVLVKHQLRAIWRYRARKLGELVGPVTAVS